MTVEHEVKVGKSGKKYVLITFRYNGFVVSKVVFLTDLEKQVLGIN